MAQALGPIRRPAAAAPLTAALAADDGWCRRRRCRRCSRSPALRDGSAVAPLLVDGDAHVRAEAATTLGMFHDASGTRARW